jgi:hypothetical protein
MVRTVAMILALVVVFMGVSWRRCSWVVEEEAGKGEKVPRNLWGVGGLLMGVRQIAGVRKR